MERPGVELATSRSQVRRANHYTTNPGGIAIHRVCWFVGWLVRSLMSGARAGGRAISIAAALPGVWRRLRFAMFSLVVNTLIVYHYLVSKIV